MNLNFDETGIWPLRGRQTPSLTFQSQGASTRVVREGLQGAGPSVGARVVVARVVGDCDLTEGGRVADGAVALKRGAPVGWHLDTTGSTILALQPSGVARVLVLAVLADVVVGASEIEEGSCLGLNSIKKFQIYSKKLSLKKFYSRILLYAGIDKSNQSCDQF